jgi:hypothetical protein
MFPANALFLKLTTATAMEASRQFTMSIFSPPGSQRLMWILLMKDLKSVDIRGVGPEDPVLLI